jgi:hypothetical protein
MWQVSQENSHFNDIEVNAIKHHHQQKDIGLLAIKLAKTREKDTHFS